MRNNRPGSIQATVAEAYEANGGLRATAQDLGLSAATLSHGAEVNEERPGGLGVNHLDRLGRMCPLSAAVLARHFAELAGGTFAPGRGPAASSLLSQSGVIAKEAGEAVAALLLAAQGGGPREAEEAVRQLDDVAEAVAAARSRLLGAGANRPS